MPQLPPQIPLGCARRSESGLCSHPLFKCYSLLNHPRLEIVECRNRLLAPVVDHQRAYERSLQASTHERREPNAHTRLHINRVIELPEREERAAFSKGLNGGHRCPGQFQAFWVEHHLTELRHKDGISARCDVGYFRTLRAVVSREGRRPPVGDVLIHEPHGLSDGDDTEAHLVQGHNRAQSLVVEPRVETGYATSPGLACCRLQRGTVPISQARLRDAQER